MKKLPKKKQYKNKAEFDIADLNAILDGNHIVKVFGPIRFVKDEIKRLRKNIKGCIASFYFPEKISNLKQKKIAEDFSKRVCPRGNIITTPIIEKGRRLIEIKVLLVY